MPSRFAGCRSKINEVISDLLMQPQTPSIFKAARLAQHACSVLEEAEQELAKGDAQHVEAKRHPSDPDNTSSGWPIRASRYG